MSFSSWFSLHESVGYFSDGVYALLALDNFSAFELGRADGLCDAHVAAYVSDQTRYMVEKVLTNFFPPPVENSNVLAVTAPTKDGQGVDALSQGGESSRLSSRTKTHLKPSGGVGCFDVDQFSSSTSLRLPRVNTSIAARISPIAASKQIPPNVIALIDITGVSSFSRIVGAA